LSAIQGYTHLLQNRIQAADIPDAERFIRGLSNIKTSTHKMVAQIDELLDAASLQAGQPLSLSWDTFNLVTVTYNAVEACQDISTAHPITVQTSEEQIIVGGDEMRMERVITNLLTNAIKYSPEGGEITVTLERQMQPENDKPGVALSVKDQGIGIPETDLPHIFNPFQRASNVSEQMKGSGLGLSSAYHIIQQQGGNITATSEEGVGSTFTIWLPTSQD
jgi:signal transduction histidine kinase